MAEFRSSRGMLMSMEIAMVAASEEDCDQNYLCGIWTFGLPKEMSSVKTRLCLCDCVWTGLE